MAKTFGHFEAYEIKPELGGGFRGVAQIVGSDGFRTDPKSTIEAAFLEARGWLLERAETVGRVTLGHYKSNRWKKTAYVWPR